MFHWWEGRTQSAYLLSEYLKKKDPKCTSHIYGYMPKNDEYYRYNKVMFDFQSAMTDYWEFMDELMKRKIVVDFCLYHTYGRTTVDTAAMRIPTIGSNRIWSIRKCWPNASCDPIDVGKAREIADKWLKDGRWAAEQLDIAQRECEFFNYKNSKNRYLAALEVARSRPKNY